MPDQWEIEVPCRDGFGRDRNAVVKLSETHHIVLLTPPGDSAVWSPGDIYRVQQALTSAHVESIRRMGGR